VVTVYMQVRGGAARVAPESLLQDIHDLKVGYIELMFTVTTLLVDRSLSNSGLHRNNFIIICVEPQQVISICHLHSNTTVQCSQTRQGPSQLLIDTIS
jgi:hypothetical protein